MKVAAINNNQNFTGRFKMNNEIKAFIDGSKYENMLRFKELLGKMKKVDDGYVYKLEKKVYVNKIEPEWLGEEEKIVEETGFELSRTKGNDESTKKWIAGFEDDGFMRGKLGELVDRLEDYYPPRAGKKTRAKATDEILNLMV